MQLFDILSRGFFRFRRGQLLETVDQVKINFDEVVIPSLHQTQASFVTFETKGRFYVTLMDLFYEKTGMRKSNDWLQDFLSLVVAARNNVNFLEEQVKKVMEADTYSDGISLQKAQIINALAAMEYISNQTMAVLSLLVVSADDTEGGNQTVSDNVYREAADVAKRIFGLLGSHGQASNTYQKLFKSIPEAVVTPNNRSQLLASLGRQADPFEDAVRSGFVPNLPLIVADTVSSVRLWKYNRDKLIKKQLEQRIMYLQTRRAGESTASLEKQIKSYSNDVEKLQDKIRNFEEKYGG